jgi:Na+(H+)/acetate symporter ActP
VSPARAVKAPANNPFGRETRREELHREAVAMGSVGLGLGAVSGLLLAGSTAFGDHTVNTLFETAAQAEARRATQAGFVTASVAVGTAAVSSLVVALVLEILSER